MMKPREIIAVTICCLTAILTAPASSRAQQTQPGPPAGTPGKYSTQPAQQGKAGTSAGKGTTTSANKGTTTAAKGGAPYRLSFAVVDFQVPKELSPHHADLGGKIAD